MHDFNPRWIDCNNCHEVLVHTSRRGLYILVHTANVGTHQKWTNYYLCPLDMTFCWFFKLCPDTIPSSFGFQKNMSSLLQPTSWLGQHGTSGDLAFIPWSVLEAILRFPHLSHIFFFLICISGELPGTSRKFFSHMIAQVLMGQCLRQEHTVPLGHRSDHILWVTCVLFSTGRPAGSWTTRGRLCSVQSPMPIPLNGTSRCHQCRHKGVYTSEKSEWGQQIKCADFLKSWCRGSCRSKNLSADGSCFPDYQVKKTWAVCHYGLKMVGVWHS